MFSKHGITQRSIARLGNVDNSTVSRWFSKNEVLPINDNKRNLRYSIEDTRKLFKDSILEPSLFKSCRTLSFYNFKGGTGKTSLCYQVSSHLAIMGFKVLVIDGDPQGHLSTSYGFDSNHEYPTLADVLNGTVDIVDCIRPVYAGLDCIPSNLSLTRIEVLLNDLPRREERISMIMDPIKPKYDFIIFDTNPTISLLNRNILVFSDFIAIVCETQPYSLNGLKLLMEDMIRFYKNMQLKMPEILVIPNKYEDRTSSSAEAMTVLRQYYEDYMIPDFAVRKSEDINNAAKLSLPLAFFVRHNSPVFEDITDLLHAILKRFNIQMKNTGDAGYGSKDSL